MLVAQRNSRNPRLLPTPCLGAWWVWGNRAAVTMNWKPRQAGMRSFKLTALDNTALGKRSPRWLGTVTLKNHGKQIRRPVSQRREQYARSIFSRCSPEPRWTSDLEDDKRHTAALRANSQMATHTRQVGDGFGGCTTDDYGRTLSDDLRSPRRPARQLHTTPCAGMLAARAAPTLEARAMLSNRHDKR